MLQPLDVTRPSLRVGARFRLRSDGSAGLYVPQTGASLEVAPDQARLLALLDGRRTVGEVMEAHYGAHRSMPLAALDDLLTSLTAVGALSGEVTSQAREQRWLSRWLKPRALGRVEVPGLGVLGALLFAALPALAWMNGGPAPLSAADVALAVVGMAWAHSLRRWFQGTVLAALGGEVRSLEWGHTALVPWVGPDVSSLVLLDRPRRAVALLAGLAGLGVSVLVAASLSRGLTFGAAVVAVIDLCPFAPTLAGRLLATLAGKVDLQEHARAFLDRKLLSRMTQRSTFEGELSLVWTSLLSLAWLGWVVRLLFTVGAQTSVRLLAVGLEETGAARALLFTGAGLLVLSLPLSLAAMFSAVARALLALRPQAAADAGTAAAGPQDTSLADVPLFARLPAAEREAVTAAGEQRTFAPGATLVHQGAMGDRFYAVLAGHVSVHVEAASGLSRQVATLGPGDCFGEAALLGEGRRQATVRAETPVTVLALGRAAFTRLQGELRADQLAAVLRNSAALKKSAFFGALPSERLSSLAFQLTPRQVEAGTTVITRGEPGAECFLVTQGRFEVLGDGGAVVATLGPGNHFGEVALLRDVPRTATVRAAEEGVVLSLAREEFLAAVTRDLRLSRSLEQLAAERAGAAS